MQPKVEAEVAFVLERDLTHEQVTLPDLISAVAYALPAIEIVGSRIAKWDIKLLDTVADNASAGLFVLGAEPRKLDGLDLRLCGMVMELKGEAGFGRRRRGVPRPSAECGAVARAHDGRGRPAAQGGRRHHERRAGADGRRVARAT